MDFVKEMKAKAIQYQNRLVLPEGTEERTVAAAAQIVAEKLAKTVTLLGEKSEIEKIAAAKGISLDGIEIIDPKTSEYAEEFANAFYELRKHKGMTPEQAKIDMESPLRFGAMMVRLGKSDSMVAGAENTTGDVLRAGLTVIGTAPGTKTASSCFVMQMKDSSWETRESIPWNSFKSEIETIEIDEGITRIGNYVFIDCPKLLSMHRIR